MGRLQLGRGGEAIRRGIVVVAAAALLAAAVARTSQAAIIKLSTNDVVTLKGSGIGCGVRDASGTSYVYCTTSRPTAAYVALETERGRVQILSVKTHKAVFDRRTAGVVRRAAPPSARIGDLIVVTGTRILCDVIKASGVPTVVCEYVDRKGVVRPNSYSFGISDSVVSSLLWDAKRQVRVLHTWRES